MAGIPNFRFIKTQRDGDALVAEVQSHFAKSLPQLGLLQSPNRNRTRVRVRVRVSMRCKMRLGEMQLSKMLPNRLYTKMVYLSADSHPSK